MIKEIRIMRNVPPAETGIPELQRWADGMDSDWGLALTLFIGVITLIRGLLKCFIGYSQVWTPVA